MSGISVLGHFLLMFPGLALINDMWHWADSGALHFYSLAELLAEWMPGLLSQLEKLLGSVQYVWDPMIVSWPAALILVMPSLLLYVLEFFFWSKREWTPFNT
ncbi:MAG TPA: hypothetical protein DCW68_06615 [Rhodospirillaceae bacterium]|nr:MAG: hypothetical protein A2018_01125 [Alphaproteobacteria bacterium GWF2_58_20]HAU29760.1 hypothetical protein [Rhodospirillaceae bacterium]